MTNIADIFYSVEDINNVQDSLMMRVNEEVRQEEQAEPGDKAESIPIGFCVEPSYLE